MATVSLREVAEEMDACMEGCHLFLNRRTGELFGCTDDSLAAAEEEDDEGLPDWQQEEVAQLREVLDSADWLKVPPRQSGDDYRIMEQFCLDQDEGQLQEQLLAAIRGRGAFGRFKDAVYRLGI